MKKLFRHAFVAALGAFALLPSCVSRQTAVETLSRCDSLSGEVRARDSLIARVFGELGAISDNLALIRTREGLITAAADAEGVEHPVERIERDIEALDGLLRDNRTKIAALQGAVAQLRKSNLRIDGLEKMVGELNRQLELKRTEVAELRGRLAVSETQVEELTEQVALQTARAEELDDERAGLENRLNTVYYIVGSERELRDAQIIDKQGIVGRTLKASGHGSFESFTQADARLLESVAVGQRRVTVVTSHPEDSYTLVTDDDKRVVELRILDPGRFWESSKMLIVSYR